MQTQFTKKIDFTGKQLFIGLDVHKRDSLGITNLFGNKSLSDQKFVQFTKDDSFWKLCLGFLVITILSRNVWAKHNSFLKLPEVLIDITDCQIPLCLYLYLTINYSTFLKNLYSLKAKPCQSHKHIELSH